MLVHLSLLGAKIIPVEGQIITWSDLYGVRSGNVAHHITSKVDGVQIFYWGVVIATFSRCAVVRWDSDASKETLVDSVHKNSLCSSVENFLGEERFAPI